jgi:diguanylate cyclase (GGDEF)-like protein
VTLVRTGRRGATSERQQKRRRRGYLLCVAVGALFAVLSPLMRDAWSSAASIAVGSGISAMLGCWVLIRFQFEPLYRKIEDSEADLQRQSDRQEFASRLSRALERSRTETDVLKVTMRAAATVDPDLPTEALIADSSRAHLRRAQVGEDLPHQGCSVVSPWDCPAMSTSQSHHFPDSEALDSCQFLRDRADATGKPLTALCLPMTSRGQVVGVLHSVRDAGAPIDRETQRSMQTIAGRTGATIGATRAFAKSQLQASTDPLTGLLNRRSFEERATSTLDGAERYGLLMADLDNFKTLNDVHGHSTGDRALRRFAEVLRSVTRPEDVVARIGGEEFIVLLPHAQIAEAAEVAERIRTRLRQRDGVSEPAFTVSLGVAEGLHVDDLHDVTSSADQALFQAKANGRDRVVLAGEQQAAAATLPAPRDGDEAGAPSTSSLRK